MLRFDGKEKMNTLLNIDNYLGEYGGRALPVVIFIGLSAIPLFVWLLFLMPFVKFTWMLPFWLFYVLRVGLIVLGKEKQKLEFYDKQRADEYKSAGELIHIFFIHDDGLIEYENGTVGYIISGFPKGYLSDAKLAVDFEKFMDELDLWNFDMFLQNAVDEVNTTEGLPKLSAYSDKEVIKERIEFYMYQDEYSRTHSSLYRYNFLVYTYKANWKKLREHLEELVSSEISRCFNEVKICNKYEVADIIDRDICGYVDVTKMLIAKHENNDFHGSKVLWYNDEIPEQFEEQRDKSMLEERRIHDADEG